MKTPILSFAFPLRLAIGVLATTLASGLIAQDLPQYPPPPSAKDSSVSYADRNFLKKAAKAGEEQINISMVAAARTANPPVKELAQMIVRDHRDIVARLTDLAVNRGVDLPAKDLTASKWEKKGADSFDKDYLKEMIDQHKDAVELFAKAAKSDDSQIASFASQQLPALQSHLSRAKDLLKTL